MRVIRRTTRVKLYLLTYLYCCEDIVEISEMIFVILQKHFNEVSTKFSKFQRPADFDTKMTHVKRVLDDIDQRLHLIELTSSDLESVQNKLDQCTVSLNLLCLKMVRQAR